MKILVLMPMNKNNLKYSVDIWKKLDADIQQRSFSIPMYIQFLVETGQAKDQVEAYFYAMASAEKLYKETKSGELLIIFGNTKKPYEFDAIFNFQDNQYKMYKDFFIEALDETIKPDGEDDESYKILSQYITNLHETNESTLILMDIDATAEFLNRYAKTDVEKELKQLKTNYLTKLDEINKEGAATIAAKKVVKNNDKRSNEGNN